LAKSNSDHDHWQKVEAQATIVVAIFAIIATGLAGYAAYTANEANNRSINVAKQALQLENITSNFQPEIIPYYVTANLRDIYTDMPTNPLGEITDYGSLNMSLIVISPHATILNFTDNNFNIILGNFTSADWINTSVYCPPPDASMTPWLPFGGGANYTIGPSTFLNIQVYNYWPEAFVAQGVSQVNFTIPITANIL
jgi:hypothetical protein